MPASVRKNARYTASTASPRGMRSRCSKATAGLRISAMRPATMNSTSTLPAAFASAHDGDDRERQQHELDPPRDDHARAALVRALGDALGSSARRLLVRGSAAPPPRRRSRGFVGAPAHLPPTIARVWLRRQAAETEPPRP